MSLYIVSRSHGLKTRLLPTNTFEAMASLRSLRDLLSFLSPTEYQKYLVKAEELDPKLFHRAYSQVFAERLNLMFSIPLPRNAKLFVSSYLRKYDYENVYRMLNGLKANKDPDEIKQSLIPINYMRVNVDDILNMRSVDRAIELLRDLGYGITNEGIELYKKFDSLLPIEADMKKAFYRGVIESIRNLNRLVSGRIESFIRTMIEIENIFTVIASYLYNYDSELLNHMILPYTKAASVEDLKRAVSTKNIRELHSILSGYTDMINHLLNKREFDAKLEANKIFVEMLNRMGVESSMNLAYVIYIVELMEYEYRNLTYITYMIYFNFPEAERKTLIFQK